MKSNSRPIDQKPSFIEAARRAQIIDAAIATVNEVGYPGASLARIAERAGISKSIISYHFSGKEELLLQLVDEVFGRLGDALVEALARESRPTAKLAAYVRTYLDHAAQHRAEMIAAMEIVVTHRTPDGVPLYLVEGEEDTAALRAIIGAGMETGEFRTGDLVVAVTTVVHALDGALTRSQMHPETDLAAWADELVPMLLTALGAPRRGDQR